MSIDPHSRLKADLYSTADDALIVSCNPTGLPFRLIIWGEAITAREAQVRIRRDGRSDCNYLAMKNPFTGAPSSVSMIDTDDGHVADSVGRGLFARCYRVLTPAAAQLEVDRWRATHAYRLVRRSRTTRDAEFAHLLDGDELIVRNVGYEPDLPRWPLSAHAEGTVHAICLNDPVVAMMLSVATGGFELQR